MRDVLLSRFHQNAALVSCEHEVSFAALISALAEHDDAPQALMAAQDDEDFWPDEDSWMAAYRPYVVKAGVLQVPVKGVLLNGFGYQFGGYATGYQYIERAIQRGMTDANVKGIALVIDSPGGEVAGNFELVEKIAGWRDDKPIRAFAEGAYSAAYNIAAAAKDITVSRSGGAGSVGVVTSHIDASRQMEQRGLKITFIFAGKHKVDGNPYEALSDSTRERIQARIDSLYSEFVALVARNRGMDEKAVRDTEALTYSASEAVSIGFADSIGALDDAVAAFAADLSLEEGVTMMSEKKDVTAVDQAALDQAHASGRAEGAAAERARITAILGSDEAKNRRETAEHLALNTDMSVEQASALLATLPEAKPAEQAEDSGALFDAAMSQANPELGAVGGESHGGTEDPVAAILGDWRGATGRKAG